MEISNYGENFLKNPIFNVKLPERETILLKNLISL